MKELPAQLAEPTTKLDSANIQIEGLKKQLESVSVNTMIKTRVELMTEFKEGKSTQWDLDEVI